MPKQRLSLSLVYLYSTFLERSNNQSLVVLQIHFAIPIQISHGHPAVDVLLGWVVVHAQHVVRFPDELGNLVLT